MENEQREQIIQELIEKLDQESIIGYVFTFMYRDADFQWRWIEVVARDGVQGDKLAKEYAKTNNVVLFATEAINVGVCATGFMSKRNKA